MTGQTDKRVEDLVLWIIAEMWLVALVVASTLFVGVVAAQALTRQVRVLRERGSRAAAELTTGTV